MNGTVLNKTDLAAWRSLLARPDKGELWLTAGIYLFAAFIIPNRGNAMLSLLFIAACAVYLVTRTNAFLPLLAPGIPALALFSLTGSTAPSAVFLALLFGGAAGAILISSVKTPREGLLLTLLPLLAFFAAWPLCGGPLTALLTLIPLPLALAGAFALRHCKPFCAAVATLAAALIAALVAVFVVTMLKNGLRPDMVEQLPALISTLEEAVLEAAKETAALYPEMDVSEVLSPTMVHNMIALTVNLSPGIFVALCLVVAYFVWRTLCTLRVALRMRPRLPRVFTTPRPSAVSAILFILAFLTALFGGSATTLVGAVAENFALILTPVFVLIGFAALFGHGAQRSCLSVFLLIGMAYLFFNNPPLALNFAALYGAIQALIVAHRGAKANKNSKGEP